MDKPHEHEWKPGGTTSQTELISKSPQSNLDDIIARVSYQTLVCNCGKVKKVQVGIDKERFRGDDMRRAQGLSPLGNLPGSHG